jgi:drug/metabolite transporter (DMT)-like permease
VTSTHPPPPDADRARDVALFLVPVLLWGTTWYAINFQLGSVAPEASVVYRFALASLLLALGCAATGRSLALPLREHRWIALQGVTMFGLAYVLTYRAQQHLPSGVLAVLFSTIVFANLAGARMFFGDRITARMAAGAVLGVGGVGLLFLPEFGTGGVAGTAAGTAAGIAFGVASVVCASTGNMVAVRNHRAGLPLLPGIAWGMAYGTATAALVAAAQGVRWTFDARAPYVLSLAYLTVFGSIAAFAAYLSLVARVGAGPASYVGVAVPVVAMMISTLLEGYRWTVPAVAGVALAVVGNVLVLRRRPARGTVPSIRG